MAEITTYLSPNGQQVTSGAGPATCILVATLRDVATLGREAPGAPWRLIGRGLADAPEPVLPVPVAANPHGSLSPCRLRIFRARASVANLQGPPHPRPPAPFTPHGRPNNMAAHRGVMRAAAGASA